MAIGVGTALVAIGAGLAIGFTAIGSGIGVGIAGAAAAGVTSEKPKKFGEALVFSAIPQTQAIYGLLTAVLLLMSTGFLGGTGIDVPVPVGLAAIGAGLAIGLAGFSAIGQGIASAAGIGATAENSALFGKGIVFAAICETQAIYGLLVAILLMTFTGILTGELSTTLAVGLAAIAGGLAAGLSGFSAIGQGIASAAGIGATAENDEMFGKGIVFAAICETQAIYGLLIAILLMTFTGMVTQNFITTISVGLATIGCGLAVGLAGFSAIGQGITAAAGIAATSRHSEAMGRGLVFAAMSETFAIFGLLVAILIMFGIGLFML
jgi:F0F1-type ATP synthase membrane subunit c/vacuolar-type H+-ATPase subunit K